MQIVNSRRLFVKQYWESLHGAVISWFETMIHHFKIEPVRSICSVLFLTGLLSCTFFSVQAQSGATSLNAPGIGVEASYLPSSHYIRPEDSLKMPANSGIRRMAMTAAFNLYRRQDSVTGALRQWTIGLSGHYMEFTNKKYEKAVMPEKLFGGAVAIQHIRSLKNRWSAMAILSAGVYSDMEEIGYDDVFLNGGVLFIKQQNSKFSYGFGAMLTNSFGTPMILPGLLLQFNTGKKFNVQIVLPEKFGVTYKVNSVLTTGIAARMNGGSYDVEKRPDNQRLMAYKELTVGWENEISVTKSVHFFVAGGAAVLRSVDYRKKSLSEMFKTKPEHKLEPNWFASAGFRIQILP